jgi:hypothetical protein
MSRAFVRGQVCAGILLLCALDAARAQAVYFRRGDANSDAKIDVSDAVVTLDFLFSGGGALPCRDAADANDDGGLDLSDAVFDLAFLFLGGPPPPAPGPTHCGYDATMDELRCASYFFCTQPIVPFDVVDGHAIIEEDISLGRPEDIPPFIIGLGRGGAFGAREGPGNLFGDRWPNGIMPYIIDPDVSRSTVLDAMKHWEERTSIRFVEHSGERDYVRFEKLTGCFSCIGRVSGEQTISLGSGCGKGQAIHEIGHALGLLHEQSRPDRDQFVRILFENIEEEQQHNFLMWPGEVLCSPYDYGSIMHYRSTAFSRNGEATIETIPSGISIGQRSGLSDGDIEYIRYRYARTSCYSNWSYAGGPVLGNAGVGRNEDGRLEIFAVGSDSALWQRWQLAPNSDWSGWNSLEGSVTGVPGVGSNTDGRLEIFVRATDGSVWQRWQVVPNGDWSGWNPMGMSSKSDIAVGRHTDGRIHIFWVGLDDALWHRWQTRPNGVWSDVESLDGIVIGAPAVGSNADGRLEVYVRGTDSQIWQRWELRGGGWSGWNPTGLVAKSDVGVGRNADGRLEIFAVGPDDALWHTWQLAPNSDWSGWESRAGECLPDAPAVGLNADGYLEVFVRGFDTGVWHTRQLPLCGWSVWSTLYGQVLGGVALGTNLDGRLEFFGVGTDSHLYQKWQVPCGQ